MLANLVTMLYTWRMDQPQEQKNNAGCCNPRGMILGFTIPFVVVCIAWTIIDYIDVSDGLEKEREIGVKATIPESELWFQALQKSLILAVPAGALGMVGVALYKKRKTPSVTTEEI